MSLMEIEWHPTAKQLRVFGVGGLLASIAAALVLHFVWGLAALWAIIVFAAGVALCVCSLVSPRFTRILYIGLTLVAMPIGLVVSFILLAAFYFLLLTPVALVFRLIGRDALCLAWRGHRDPKREESRLGTRPALASRGHPGLARPERDSGVAPEVQGQDALATSYWVPHRPSEDMERYFHQF